MKPALSLLLLVVCSVLGVPAAAQESVRPTAIFSRQALMRALPPDTSAGEGQLDPRHRWTQIRDLRANTEIYVTSLGAGARRCRFLSADDVSITVVELGVGGQPTRRLAREEVLEVSRWFGSNGSVVGAAVGAGGGFLLGFLTASMLAYKDCGGDCTDETLLMGVALVGTPIAGGILGYRLPGGNRDLRIIYMKP